MLNAKTTPHGLPGSTWGELAPLEWTGSAGPATYPFERTGMEDCALGIRPAFSAYGDVSAIRLQINRLAMGREATVRHIWETAEDVARATEMPLWLRVNSADWLRGLLSQLPHHLLSVEVPTFMIASADMGGLLEAPTPGPGLVLFGRPELPLSEAVQRRTNCVIVDRDDERRRPLLREDAELLEIRKIPFFHDNCQTRHHLHQALGAGALGVLGHEAFEALPDHEAGPDAQTYAATTLLRLVLTGGSIAAMRDLLNSQPLLQAPLLHLMNAPELGSKRNIDGIDDAMTLAMRGILTRAAAVLMFAHGDSPAQRVLRFSTIRRALFVDSLLAGIGHQEFQEMAFVATTLTAAEPLLGQSLDTVARAMRLPTRLREALVGKGNLAPWIRLAELSDSASPAQLALEANALLLGQTDLNTALLRSVVHAKRLCRRLDAAKAPGAMH